VKSSADLRRELAEAEARERAAIKARKAATPPKFEFWITPAQYAADGSYIFGKTYDPTCLLYVIERRCSNKEDARAVGWSDDELKEGSATYLYNVVTRRIICAVGGGTIYISTLHGLDKNDYADDQAFFAIGAFLAEYPGGGEITWLYDIYRAERKLEGSTNGHPAKSLTA
jgi:hypothetical protein